MTTKFTPAPWTYYVSYNENISIMGEDGYCVAVFRPDPLDSWDIERANAHLIAAAPDMYEALDRIAASQLENYGQMAPFIKQALTKARGEATEAL